MRSFAVAALIFSIGLVLAAAFPWGDLVGHTHWSRVAWLPFVRRLRLLDVAGNLVLFAPMGAVLGLEFRRGVAGAIVTALALSLFVEAMQLFSHLRFPSATDVFCNVLGAGLSAALVRKLEVTRKWMKHG